MCEKRMPLSSLHFCRHAWTKVSLLGSLSVYQSVPVCVWASLTHHVEQPNLCWLPFLETSCCRCQTCRKWEWILLNSPSALYPSSSSFHLFICTAGAGPRALNQTHDLAFIPSMCVCVCVWLCNCCKNQPCAHFLSGDSHLYLNTRPGKRIQVLKKVRNNKTVVFFMMYYNQSLQ